MTPEAFTFWLVVMVFGTLIVLAVMLTRTAKNEGAEEALHEVDKANAAILKKQRDGAVSDVDAALKRMSKHTYD